MRTASGSSRFVAPLHQLPDAQKPFPLCPDIIRWALRIPRSYHTGTAGRVEQRIKPQLNVSLTKPTRLQEAVFDHCPDSVVGQLDLYTAHALLPALSVTSHANGNGAWRVMCFGLSHADDITHKILRCH
jgi:hypothetical protein